MRATEMHRYLIGKEVLKLIIVDGPHDRSRSDPCLHNRSVGIAFVIWIISITLMHIAYKWLWVMSVEEPVLNGAAESIYTELCDSIISSKA